MKMLIPALACSVILLSACDSPEEQARDQAEDRIEQSAEQSAQAAGDAIVALGMTERQLLDADLISVDGTDLGDVQAVVRGPTGQVERLLIEVEDSNPDRFVHIPLDGLTPQEKGMDRDIVTNLTRAQIAALPDVKLDANAPTGTTP